MTASIHKGIINSSAIEFFNINPQNIDKSIFEKIQSTGALSEIAFWDMLSNELFPRIMNYESTMEGLRYVLTMGRTKGVTTSVDMGIGLSTGTESELSFLRAADKILDMPKCRKGYLFAFRIAYMENEQNIDKTFEFIDQHNKNNRDDSMLCTRPNQVAMGKCLFSIWE